MDNEPLQLLILEDNPDDAELLVRQLKRAGFKFEWSRVETEADYLQKLEQKIDIILSDYAMPHFSGLRALQLLRVRGLDIPFVLISDTIGEEVAVSAMREGAADYLLKDRLARLGQAMEHALLQKRLRDERKRAEEELRVLTQQHELILNSAAEGIHGLNLDGQIIFENPKGAELLGWKPNELIGKPAHRTMHHTHANGAPYPIQECPIYKCMRDGETRRITNDSSGTRMERRFALITSPRQRAMRRERSWVALSLSEITPSSLWPSSG
jgi:PAS domain S-box-containing protein